MEMQESSHILSANGVVQVFLEELAGGQPGKARLASGGCRRFGHLMHLGGFEEQEFHKAACGEIIGCCTPAVLQSLEKMPPVLIQHLGAVVGIEKSMTSVAFLRQQVARHLRSEDKADGEITARRVGFHQRVRSGHNGLATSKRDHFQPLLPQNDVAPGACETEREARAVMQGQSTAQSGIACFHSQMHSSRPATPEHAVYPQVPAAGRGRRFGHIAFVLSLLASSAGKLSVETANCNAFQSPLNASCT